MARLSMLLRVSAWLLLMLPAVVTARDTSLVVAGIEADAPRSVLGAYPATLARLDAATATSGGVPARLLIHRPGVLALPDRVAEALQRAESFWLVTDPARQEIRLVSVTDAGIVQGLNRLATLLEQGSGRLQAGEVLDWPTHPLRAFHVTLRDVTPQMLRNVVDDVALAGFNTLVVQLSDAVDFGHPAIVPRRNAMTADAFMRVVEHARHSGLRVIPEVKLLSHQEKFLAPSRPDLLYNAVTYDPRREEVYELVFSYLDTLIAVMQPDAIHIGHDEIRGITEKHRKKHLRPGETVLPPALFLQDVERLHAWLTQRSLEVWMWGDMLLAPEEFPAMLERHLHGNMEYAALRGRLPRDIVICDWHYKDEGDFSSLQAFADEGYRVLGATWKTPESTRAFSRFAATMKPPAAGMMATSWWHLRRRDWPMMARIINDSSAAFWNGE